MNFYDLFPDVREKGKTPHRQCQLVMLRMLKILDHLCTKHRIKYFLTGGTLLGAIRHQGFIPWDDDLDVGMTRENYEKFVQHAVPELPDDIFFQNDETDEHYPSCDFVEAKLRDKYSSYRHLSGKNESWHEGLQVDIFVYDQAFLSFKIFIILQNLFLRLLRSNKRRANILKRLERYIPVCFVYASSYLHRLGMLKSPSLFITSSEIASLVRVKFEDMEVWIPKGWHTLLKRQYGNYLQLPSLKKRVSPHNVELDPFTPCKHKDTLYWKERVEVKKLYF